MKIKNIFTYCFISSLFLFSLICIWKILVTLQGIELTNFNFNKLFIFGIVLCVINLLIGKKFNFFPIRRFNTQRIIPKINNLLKLKFVRTIPCNVTKIFQIQINKNKNRDEIKQ